jgi:hypothetical protein
MIQEILIYSHLLIASSYLLSIYAIKTLISIYYPRTSPSFSSSYQMYITYHIILNPLLLSITISELTIIYTILTMEAIHQIFLTLTFAIIL